MPLKIKRQITNDTPLRRAARKRVLDEGIKDLTERQIDLRVSNYLANERRKTTPDLFIGQVLHSHGYRQFLRDGKFFSHMNNAQLSDLEREIRNVGKEGIGLLGDIQTEADTLNSIISEEEIKLLGNFDTVHFNAFVRQRDMGLSWEQKDWLFDYKTNLPFLVDYVADVIPGTGITLPVRNIAQVPIVDAVLVGEETDVGDSRWPVVSSTPRNVFLEDKIWRYAIMRREFDKTSRKFKHNFSYATLQLELPNLQNINYLEIKPVCQRALVIDEISFVNEAGETVTVDTVTVDLETNTLILFEPIRTRYLRIKLKATAPVAKTQYNVTDWSRKEINDVLRGTGWSQTLPESGDLLQGRIFDFSIEEINVGLRLYEPLGCFRSRPIRVTSPVGVALNSKAETIKVSNEQRAYGASFSLPEGVVLTEYYLGIKLNRPGGRLAMRDLVPIPDSYPVQREFLPLVGAEARVKLFPDFRWTLDKYKVQSIDQGGQSDPQVTVTTIYPHGFEEGQDVTVIGRADYPLNGDWEIFDVTETTFKFRVPSYVDEQIVTANTVPFVFVHSTDGVPDPFVVRLDEEELVLGPDYRVSLDGGSTWYSQLPIGEEFTKAKANAQAGDFKIKFTNPSYERFYWIEYRPLKNQILSRDKLVKLKNGRVIFDRRLRGTKGTISTVIVSRSDNPNPLISPVILFYSLKVRENVS